MKRDRQYHGRAFEVMTLLLLINCLNMLDRNLPFILAEAIKQDLDLSDKQIGLLGGLVFAVVYTLGGLPFGRLADRGFARQTIALAVMAWSAMTALGGLAQNFLHLGLARLGVATGEAALAPAAHAIISRDFPVRHRASMIAIFSVGIPIGYMLGLALGGWLLDELGWRHTFLAVGVPGLVLGLLAWWRLPGPDEDHLAAAVTSMPAVIRYVFAKSSFRHIVAGATLYSFAGYSLVTFLPSFLMRSHGLGATETGLWLGLVTGVSGTLGIPLSGFLADRLAARDARWRLWIPALLMATSAPFVAAAMLAKSATGALALLFVPLMLTVAYVGPAYSAVHAIAPPHMRALAVSCLIGALTLFGASFGPPLVGALSDWLSTVHGEHALARAILWLVPATLLLSALEFFVSAGRLRGDLYEDSTGE